MLFMIVFFDLSFFVATIVVFASQKIPSQKRQLLILNLMIHNSKGTSIELHIKGGIEGKEENSRIKQVFAINYFVINQSS